MVLLLVGIVGACSTTVTLPSTPPNPTPSLSGSPMAFLSRDAGIAFSVPGGWTVTETNIVLHYEDVLAYLGTGSGQMVCNSDYIPGAGGTCAAHLYVPDNGIEVEVAEWSGPSLLQEPVDVALATDPLASPATVAGMPAAVHDGGGFIEGATRGIKWTIAKPGEPWASFVLTANLKGPETSLSLAALSQIITSIWFPSPAPT